MTADSQVTADSDLNTPIRVCRLSDLVAGEGLRVDTISPPVAVFLTEDDEVFAIDDTCTHQDASLADGWLEGCEVECPLHASRFDLRTGQVDAPPAKIGVRAHTVKVEGDEVYLTLSSAEPRLPPGLSA
jgi:3-phenylpropionate/trans-cinnamate dioxygenase ferredoxin subunit